MAVLAELDAATGLDLTTLDDDALAALASKAQKGRKTLSGLSSRIHREALRREATGSSRPAESSLQATG